MNNDVVSLMCLRTPTIAIVDVCVASGKHWLRFEQGSMPSDAQITQSPSLLGPCRINSFHIIRINADDTCYSRCNGVSPKTGCLKAYLYTMMSEALEVNTVLTTIDLDGNQIGDDGAAALAQVLEQTSMRM